MADGPVPDRMAPSRGECHRHRRPVGSRWRWTAGTTKLNDYATAQYEEALRTVRDPHASADEKRNARAIIERTEHRHGRP
jgi:hypothetical protein